MNLLYQGNYQRVFGTYPLVGEQAVAAVSAALAVGYRAFDTAQMYGNEQQVGEALAASSIERSQVCITTKVMPGNFAEGRFMASVEDSLRQLRVDWVDLLLLHWPPADGNIMPSLKLLAQAKARGLATHIGVSNYTAAMLRKACRALDVPLTTNQVEFHPLLNQRILLAAAAETGIPLSAYCSVARGEVFGHSLFAEIGKSYRKSAAQVVLRWIIQQGVVAITMSTNRQHMRANYDIMDFVLSSVDMARIDALTSVNRRIVDANIVPWAPKFD